MHISLGYIAFRAFAHVSLCCICLEGAAPELLQSCSSIPPAPITCLVRPRDSPGWFPPPTWLLGIDDYLTEATIYHFMPKGQSSSGLNHPIPYTTSTTTPYPIHHHYTLSPSQPSHHRTGSLRGQTVRFSLKSFIFLPPFAQSNANISSIRRVSCVTEGLLNLAFSSLRWASFI